MIQKVDGDSGVGMGVEEVDSTATNYSEGIIDLIFMFLYCYYQSMTAAG